MPIKRLVGAICALAVVEWALFELLRTPYRPPQDMSTFLGTEKYVVVALMQVLAVGGLSLMWWWGARSAWTKRDVTVIALVVAILLGAGIYVVINPGWPVTPLNAVVR